MSADSYYAMKRAGKTWRSGFCGIGVEAHDKCKGGYERQIKPVGWVPCACDCHQTPADATAPSTPSNEVERLPVASAGLRILPNLEQRSEEWYNQRRGMVTASVVGKLVTPTLKVADNETSRGLAATLIAERITGWTEETPLTPDMWRGVEHEPFARDVYSAHYHQAEQVGFMIREGDGWTLGYSPDGLVGVDGLLEIKCPRPKTHLQTILADAVPDYHMAQLQAGLLVSGRKWIDYVSFVAGMPLFVKRVYPDQKWHDAITAACVAFEENAAQIVADYRTRVRDMPKTERLDNSLGLVF